MDTVFVFDQLFKITAGYLILYPGIFKLGIHKSNRDCAQFDTS